MVVFSDITDTTCYRTSHVILEVAVESLMLTVVNFEVCELTTAMLSRKGAFLHIHVLSVLLFLFGLHVRSTTDSSNAACTNIIAILIIE